MSDLLFFAVDPDPNFVDRLESLLLAELELEAPSADAPDADLPPEISIAPASGSPSRPHSHRRARRLVTAISVAAAAAALLVLVLVPRDHGPVEPPDTTPGPTSTTSTTPTPSTLPVGSEAVPAPRNGSTLDAGTTYRVGRQAIQHSFTFTNTIQDAVGNSWSGQWAVVEPRGGHDRLYVGLIAATLLRTFNEPLSDVYAPVSVEEATSLLTGSPLSHLAALPGVIAEPIVDATVLGLPAKAMRFRVGDVSSGHPCHKGLDDPCVLAFYAERSSTAIGYASGESGTFYELTIDDTVYLLGVNDAPGVAELVASIRLIN